MVSNVSSWCIVLFLLGGGTVFFSGGTEGRQMTSSVVVESNNSEDSNATAVSREEMMEVVSTLRSVFNETGVDTTTTANTTVVDDSVSGESAPLDESASPVDSVPAACGSLDAALVAEIRGYQASVDSIISHVTKGVHRGETYRGLVDFVDTFGPRISGSEALERSIDSVMSAASEVGFDNVTSEDVQVKHWVRTSESARLVSPRHQSLNILGLGGSVGTGPEGITADVVVVSDFEGLAAMTREAVSGKVVVFNQEFVSYPESVQYRVKGAVEAAKLGAVAALVRSVTDFSINSPHTGTLFYDDDVPKIPSASLTVEDAGLLYRLYSKGVPVRVHLAMSAVTHPDATSRNVLIDHRGSELPEDLVVVSGHVDSWDVGAGAMDDAGGCFISYHACLVLKTLGLRARRTIRNVWFTGEEQGLHGGKAYFAAHRNDSARYQLLLESDEGTFEPRGISFTGSQNAACVIREILKLTRSINTTELVAAGDISDISMWGEIGVPIGSLNQEPNRYFWYHHTDGDRAEVLDPATLDRITALWATVAYVVADISANLQLV